MTVNEIIAELESRTLPDTELQEPYLTLDGLAYQTPVNFWGLVMGCNAGPMFTIKHDVPPTPSNMWLTMPMTYQARTRKEETYVDTCTTCYNMAYICQEHY